MNSRTKKALEDFIDQVENLAYGVVLTVGTEQVSAILTASTELKSALASDETILEIK